MLKFELNIADRKILANRMEELTGIHPYYTILMNEACKEANPNA